MERCQSPVCAFTKRFADSGVAPREAHYRLSRWIRQPKREGNLVRFASALLFLMLLTGMASSQPEIVRKRLYPQFPCLPGEWPCTVVPQPKPPFQPLPDVRRVPQPPPFPDLGRRPPHEPGGSRG